MTTTCPTRRLILAALALPGLAYGTDASPVVTMLGDSITAGYGLARGQALPDQLRDALARIGRKVTMRAAGVSGDTTAAGLARVDFSVQSDTRLCLVALGGNDLLQGVAPATTKANLLAILDRLQKRRIKTMLVGIAAPVALGGDYAREFNAVFPAVAKAKGVALYPDVLAGLAGNRSLIQADGVHPSAAGAGVIASRLAPVVARALG